MKKVLTIIVILLVFFVVGTWYYYFGRKKSANSGSKDTPIAVSKHSDPFNTSIEEVLDTYYKMTGGFVKSDTTVISRYATELIAAFDKIKMDELKNDTTRYANKIYLTAMDYSSNAKNETTNILQHPGWDDKRKALNNLTDNLRTLLITIKYDRRKIYYEECLTAFSNENPAYWLSPTKDINSPYPGMKDECGSIKDSIDFMPKDTTRKNL